MQEFPCGTAGLSKASRLLSPTACFMSPLCTPPHCSFRPQAIFTLLLGPFTFFDVQKTKYLQILTSLMRWIGESEKSPLCLPFSPMPPSASAEKPGKLPAGMWQRFHPIGLPGPLTFPEGTEEASAPQAFYCWENLVPKKCE